MKKIMAHTSIKPGRRSAFRAFAVVLCASTMLGACMRKSEPVVTASFQNDYRLRHPIVVQEADRTVEVFVGSSRGGLTGPQRADIAAVAQAWLREGTGAIIIDQPVDTPNARPAHETAREILSLLAASGVPSRGVRVRDYKPSSDRQFATVRVNYPRIVADAGPCGVWPEDIGPSIKNKGYYENRQWHNFGCAYQRNLAAMVDNPADLVQPRAEAPAYTARRSIAYDKYRKGTSTTTLYPEADKAKLSDVGK